MNREEAQDLIEKLQLWLNGEQVEFYSRMEAKSVDVAFMQAPKLTVKPKPREIWVSISDSGFGYAYDSKEDAERYGLHHFPVEAYRKVEGAGI